jgi:hypothetical protein
MNQPNTRRADLPETPWAFAALCADMPAEIFDVATGRLQTAKAACAHCTVAHQCLRWAINNEIEDEIWGGRSPAERRRLGRAFVLDLPQSAASELALVKPVVGTPPTRSERPPEQRGSISPRTRIKTTTPAPPDVMVPSPKARTSAQAECGTEAGYKRHRRLGEETCQDCRRAVRNAQADRAARHAAGVPVATRAKVAPCGTPAGYARHRNQGEDACDSCMQANRTYLRTYRAQTRSVAS